MMAMPLRFALCFGCDLAWTATTIEPCPWCGEVPIDCSPWGSDRRKWLEVSLSGYVEKPGERVADVYAVVDRDHKAHRRSLYQGIVARGNTSVRGTARRAA